MTVRTTFAGKAQSTFETIFLYVRSDTSQSRKRIGYHPCLVVLHLRETKRLRYNDGREILRRIRRKHHDLPIPFLFPDRKAPKADVRPTFAGKAQSTFFVTICQDGRKGSSQRTLVSINSRMSSSSGRVPAHRFAWTRTSLGYDSPFRFELARTKGGDTSCSDQTINFHSHGTLSQKSERLLGTVAEHESAPGRARPSVY